MAQRQWPMVGAVMVAMVMGLAGCALPAGVDGKIADHWAMPAAALQVVPKVGECHTGIGELIKVTTEVQVDCAKLHSRETTYVGEFSAAVAGQRKAPRLDTFGLPEVKTAQAEAYAECDRRTTEYVGHPWYHLRLRVEVALPPDDAWRSGRKWYRCELVEIDLALNAIQTREGSLKGVTLPHTCLSFASESSAKAVPCTAEHNAEYVNTFLGPAPSNTSALEPDYPPLHSRCRAQAAPYIGVSASQVESLTGTYVWFDYPFTYWFLGRRLVHCLLWFDSATMIGSAQGKHGRNLP